jgi:hypothetical protein
MLGCNLAHKREQCRHAAIACDMLNPAQCQPCAVRAHHGPLMGNQHACAGISASVIALSRSVKCFTFGWLKCPDYGNGPANHPTQAGEKGKGEVS